MEKYTSDRIIAKKSLKIPAILCVVSVLISIAFIIYCVGLVAFFSSDTKKMLAEKFGRLPIVGIVFIGVLIASVREMIERRRVNKRLERLFGQFDMNDLVDQANNYKVAEFETSKSVPCILTQKYIIVPGKLVMPIAAVAWISELNTGINDLWKVVLRTEFGQVAEVEYKKKFATYDNLRKYLPTIKEDVIVGPNRENEYRERLKRNKEVNN